jgi:hypothetical protein
LDFFVIKSPTYEEQGDKVFAILKEAGYFWSITKNFIRGEYFTSFEVGHQNHEVLLKLDFVNDIDVHFGDFQKTDIYHRTDSVRNILSNKISAIYRFAAKDFIDIWAIAKHEKFNWVEIIHEVKEKDAGIEPTSVSNILQTIPEKELDKVAWVKRPTWEEFCADIRQIAIDMLNGSDTSLVKNE